MESKRLNNGHPSKRMKRVRVFATVIVAVRFQSRQPCRLAQIPLTPDPSTEARAAHTPQDSILSVLLQRSERGSRSTYSWLGGLVPLQCEYGIIE